MTSDMKNLRPQDTLRIKVVGSLTGETWAGDFRIWRVLTHRQQIERDRITREFLGTSPSPAIEETGRATALADLQVRVITSPKWWEACGNGADMIDNEVLGAIYKAAIESENGFYEERRKAAEEAAGKLPSAVAKMPETTE